MTSREAAMGGGKARILIVDDHPLVRAGFQALIGDEPDFEVCGEAEGFTEALRLADDRNPDAAIVDLSLADGSGLELVKRLHARHPGIRLLVCSVHDESVFADRVLNAGALGYVNKRQATGQVMAALRCVLAGNTYRGGALTAERQTGLGRGDTNSVEKLSDRELEVFVMIGRGRDTAQIAAQLHLSVKTVETHRENLKKKLELDSATQLARCAAQWNLDHG